MALRSDEFTERTIPLEVSFSYEDVTKQRCMLTYKSYRNGIIRFAPSRIDISRTVQSEPRVLTQQERRLLAGIRRAETSAYVPTDLIRLAPNYAIFGPYRLEDIAERNMVILTAIRDAYLEYDKFFLTFTDNWPMRQVHEVKSRLSASDCKSYIAGFRG